MVSASLFIHLWFKPDLSTNYITGCGYETGQAAAYIQCDNNVAMAVIYPSIRRSSKNLALTRVKANFSLLSYLNCKSSLADKEAKRN